MAAHCKMAARSRSGERQQSFEGEIGGGGGGQLQTKNLIRVVRYVCIHFIL